MHKPVVIVESPAKAKTIAKFLGKDWAVSASIGHVRDLPSSAAEIPKEVKEQPWGRLGINVDQRFEPVYVVHKDKKKVISELKALLKNASALYLATDEDREGEAISWHLLELLKPKVPVKRMVFHEITQKAIDAALENCREIDMQLVQAQEARRLLDRLYGYEVSPVLWRKIGQPGLSAGRVQSVATRLLVDRERERMAFRSASWWDAAVRLEHKSVNFPAQVTALDGQGLAQGRDFGSDGRLLAGRTVRVLDQTAAQRLAQGLDGAQALVRKVEEKDYKSEPKPPFTTSTLQQEAGRKLGFAAKRAMQAAQRLYENGFITYMRTDSIALSEEAIAAARILVQAEYGPQYLNSTPRQWKGKSKNAQEAHEAIRPAGERFRPPEQVSAEVGPDEGRIYELIFRRTVASQMVDARMRSLAASFDCALKTGGNAELIARGRTVVFDGYLRAYEEGHDESEAAKDKEDEAVLPPLAVKDVARVASAKPASHATKPPARYTEAALVQKLEELGIGRPSTYASILGTIQDREYCYRQGAALVPTPLAFAVVQLVQKLDPMLVDYSFTAEMEEELDQIALGTLDRTVFLERFYKGDHPGLHQIVNERAKSIDPKAVSTIEIGQHDGETVCVRVGRYGPYLDFKGQRANLPEGTPLDEVTIEKALELLATASQAEEPLGNAPTGEPVYVRTGRFGPYVQLGDDPEDKQLKPKRASLFKSLNAKDLTLEQALALLSLPRNLGTDSDGGVVLARPGRFGPYLEKSVPGAPKPETRSLKSEEQLLSITLEEARALFAIPKLGRGQRGGGASAPPLRELGVDPVSGTPLVVRDGKYGNYVSDGTTHATLPKDVTVESLTPAQAAAMLVDKRARAPAKKKSARRAAPRAKAKKG